jgi:hypothetical protein
MEASLTYFEPVWLRDCGGILIKTQFVIVWLKKKLYIVHGSHLIFALETQLKKKARIPCFSYTARIPC